MPDEPTARSSPEPTARSSPEVRLSDRDRDGAVETLRRSCGEGRLTLQEFSERMEIVLAARTAGDLERVMEDLPSPAATAPGADRPKETGWTVAVLGSSSHRGRWRPSAHTKVVSLLGSCQLDLRRAEIGGPELKITAFSFMGSVDVVVPEGVDVELSGLPILGDKSLNVADVDLIPGAPRVRVLAIPLLGSIAVRSKRQRKRARGGESHGVT